MEQFSLRMWRPHQCWSSPHKATGAADPYTLLTSGRGLYVHLSLDPTFGQGLGLEAVLMVWGSFPLLHQDASSLAHSRVPAEEECLTCLALKIVLLSSGVSNEDLVAKLWVRLQAT